MSPIIIVAWVLSVAFTALIGAGVVTYIRRTWQLIKSHSDETAHDRLLDGIDQLQTQLYMVAERLGEIERQLANQNAAGSLRLPRSPGEADEPGGAADEDVREK